MALEVLQSTGRLKLQVTGTSMLPTLWPGDILTLQSIASDPPRHGEIIFFQREPEGQFVIHRVVETEPGLLITRGDSLADQDAPVSLGEVLGRVVEVQRGGKRRPPALSLARRIAAFVFAYSDIAVRLALRFQNSFSQDRGITSVFFEGVR